MPNKEQPEFRFSKFEGNWEESKAKNIFKSINERNQPNLPVLSVTQDSGVVFRDDVGIDIKYDKTTLNSYKVIYPGNFVISLRSFQGGFELSDKHGITSPAYTVFIPQNSKNQNELFWKTKFKTFKFIESLKTVTFGIRDGKSISFSEFGDLKLKYPSDVDEQKEIGSFFEELDKNIALHQQELAALKQTKQGFLQKMFPKEGEKVPEVRFPGFNDDWDHERLESTVEVKSGRDYKHLNKGDIPVYGTGGYMLSVNEALSDTEDAIGIGRKGTIDKPYLLKAPFWTVDTLFYSIPKKGYDLDFVNNIFQRINWKKMDESTGVPSLSKAVINAIQIQIPSFEEQKMIGYFFKQFDDTIALHQRELELLQLIKKAFLQKLFV